MWISFHKINYTKLRPQVPVEQEITVKYPIQKVFKRVGVDGYTKLKNAWIINNDDYQPYEIGNLGEGK